MLSNFGGILTIMQGIEEEVTTANIMRAVGSIFLVSAQMTFVASKFELGLLLKKLASLERILVLKIHPMSENVWICIHNHSLTWTL
jgi:hypothetical protein